MLSVQTKVYIVVGGASAVSFAAGAAASYFFLDKKMQVKYERIASDEIADAKIFYSTLHKAEEFSDPTEIMRSKYVEIVGNEYGDFHVEEPEDLVAESEQFITHVNEEVERVVNIFAEHSQDDENFIMEEELQRRTNGKPYVVSYDEFYVNEDDLEQVTLTFYEADDILIDERDTVIPDSDALVGDQNLSRFGHGSKDKNVVYIRNDSLSLLFEVVLNKGNYAKEVLGFIEHSDHRGLRKFRSDDE